MVNILCVLSKKSLPTQQLWRLRRLLPIFPPKSCIDLTIKLRSIIHLKLIIDYAGRWEVRFLFFPYGYEWFQFHLLESHFCIHCISWRHCWESMITAGVGLLWPSCLSIRPTTSAPHGLGYCRFKIHFEVKTCKSYTSVLPCQVRFGYPRSFAFPRTFSNQLVSE